MLIKITQTGHSKKTNNMYNRIYVKPILILINDNMILASLAQELPPRAKVVIISQNFAPLTFHLV